MVWVKTLGLVVSVGCFLGAQSLTEDPVMKARLQRSQAQGIDEADLPPVPRTITEPPPLPPPETHIKDSPHPPAAKRGRRGLAARRGGKRAKAAGPAARGSHVAKGPRGHRSAVPAGPGRKAHPSPKLSRKPKKRVIP